VDSLWGVGGGCSRTQRGRLADKQADELAPVQGRGRDGGKGGGVVERPHPRGERLTNRLKSWHQPVKQAQALPVSHTTSRVKRARGTMQPLPTMPSTTVTWDSPARLAELVKFLACVGRQGFGHSIASPTEPCLGAKGGGVRLGSILSELRLERGWGGGGGPAPAVRQVGIQRAELQTKLVHLSRGFCTFQSASPSCPAVTREGLMTRRVCNSVCLRFGVCANCLPRCNLTACKGGGMRMVGAGRCIDIPACHTLEPLVGHCR